jgi:hypothetical protein
VGNSVNSVTITAATNHASASVFGDGIKQLSTGANSIEITVTAEDGTTVKIYTVTVTRSQSGYVGNSSGGSTASVQPAPPAEDENKAEDETANANAPWTSPFTDVKTSDWFYSDVEFVVNEGLFNGISETSFGPGSFMTRAMLVTVLHRLEGSPAPGGGAAFGDVAAGLWYSDAVAWAAGTGVVNGVGGGNFAPNAEISRQDLAVILMRYAEKAGKQFPVTLQYTAFTDEDAIADYANNAVQTLYSGGIIGGKPANTFDPKGGATRAEVAAMLHRFIERTE